MVKVEEYGLRNLELVSGEAFCLLGFSCITSCSDLSFSYSHPEDDINENEHCYISCLLYT